VIVRFTSLAVSLLMPKSSSPYFTCRFSPQQFVALDGSAADPIDIQPF
jgi:hypothetical protein